MWERLWSDRENARSLTSTNVDNQVGAAIRENWYDRCYYVYSTTRLVVRVCGSDARLAKPGAKVSGSCAKDSEEASMAAATLRMS